MFTGFPEATERFFLDLRYHNNSTWYQANKDRYLQDVQAPFYSLIEDLIPVLREIDPLVEVRPHKLLSRLRRDTRFSKDKTPYRDHLWIWFKRGGEERRTSLGYWFEYGVNTLSWGMATWDENRPLMDRFRRELAANPARCSGLIHACGLPERHLRLDGSIIHRLDVPPGLPDTLLPWYRLRQPVITQTRFEPGEAASRRLLGHAASDFRAMAPIYRLLRGMQDELERTTPAAPDTDTGIQHTTIDRKYQDEW